VIIFSLFAALTQGNGAMVPAVISIVLLLQKRWKASFCFVITCIAFLLIFQYKNLSALFSLGSMAGNLWTKLDYTFSFLGAALAFSHHLPAFLFGMLILLYFIFLSLIKYYRSNPIIYGYFLFLIISVGTNAQFRAPVGIISYTIPRYCFLSVLLLIMIYISLIEILNNHRFFRFVFVSSLILSIVFYLVSYRLHFDDYRRNHLLLKDYMLCWQLGADVVPDANQRRCLKIQKKALKKGILKPPDVNISDYYSERITPDKPFHKRQVMYNIDNFVETPECVLVKGWAFIDEDSEGSEIFLVLRSAYVQYVFTLLRRDRPDVTAHYKEVFNERNLDHSGFIGVIEKSKLIEDDYQLGIIVMKDETAAIKMLPQAVSVS
jgi:hypothetical protein